MNDQGIQNAVLQQAADAGRGTDTILAHLTLGEVVIPREMVEDPEVQQVLASIYQAYGADMREFTVGDPANKINPETGNPEFFFKKIKSIFKKIAPVALPILGSMIPGVGTALGAALGGAAGGLASGGGVKGALTGAALGGIGGAITGGAGGILGTPAGTFGPATAAQVTGAGSTNAALSSLAQGSGIRGALSSLTSGSGGMGGLSNLAKIGSSVYSYNQEDDAAEKARKAMLQATGKAESALNPYSELGLKAQQQLSGNLASGFDPGDITSDPGYQFRLNQGMDELNTSLAAQGLSQSGGAMKELEKYRQGFAAQEYGNAYDRWLQQNQQLAGVGGTGANTAQALGSVYGAQGDVDGMYLQQEAERKNKRIADILAGLGL